MPMEETSVVNRGRRHRSRRHRGQRFSAPFTQHTRRIHAKKKANSSLSSDEENNSLLCNIAFGWKQNNTKTLCHRFREDAEVNRLLSINFTTILYRFKINIAYKLEQTECFISLDFRRNRVNK